MWNIGLWCNFFIRVSFLVQFPFSLLRPVVTHLKVTAFSKATYAFKPLEVFFEPWKTVICYQYKVHLYICVYMNVCVSVKQKVLKHSNAQCIQLYNFWQSQSKLLNHVKHIDHCNGIHYTDCYFIFINSHWNVWETNAKSHQNSIVCFPLYNFTFAFT